MTHLLTALFFSLLFIGVGIAGQAMLRDYWQEIVAALKGEPPVRRPAPAPRLTVTLRAQPRFAPAQSRRVAA